MGLCIVKGCGNHSLEGTFIGPLCAPCHEMLITGVVKQPEHKRTFIHKLVLIELQYNKIKNIVEGGDV